MSARRRKLSRKSESPSLHASEAAASTGPIHGDSPAGDPAAGRGGPLAGSAGPAVPPSPVPAAPQGAPHAALGTPEGVRRPDSAAPTVTPSVPGAGKMGAASGATPSDTIKRRAASDTARATLLAPRLGTREVTVLGEIAGGEPAGNTAQAPAAAGLGDRDPAPGGNAREAGAATRSSAPGHDRALPAAAPDGGEATQGSAPGHRREPQADATEDGLVTLDSAPGHPGDATPPGSGRESHGGIASAGDAATAPTGRPSTSVSPAAAAAAAGAGAGDAGAQSLRTSMPTDGRVATDADYQIVRKIGAGGMGAVYVARQNTLARDVALKMVRPEYAGSEGTEALFLSEALVTGDLEHPNIVPVYDLGRTAQGQPFMAMKLVRGIAWSTLLHPEDGDAAAAQRAAGMGVRDHVDILIKVCDAVAYAHSKGIIHRDLKPTNVMVGAFGEVLVMDWGICVDVHETPGKIYKTAPRSQASGIAGTPHYMAPELARGETHRFAPQTDVYLLGAILYEVLTLTPPHRGSTVREVVDAAAAGVVEPPWRRAPERTPPRELSRIAMRALARDPQDRYTDALAFRDALRDFLAHEESLRLSEAAARDARLLLEPGAVPAHERYGTWARVLSRLAEALHLWPGNEDAVAQQADALSRYADEALERGDAGLAASQIPGLQANRRTDPARLSALRAALDSHARLKRRSMVSAALVVFLLLLLQRTLAAQHEKVEALAHAEAVREDCRVMLTTAWNSVRDADLPRLSAAIGRLEPTGAPGDAELAQGVHALRVAQAVLLWRAWRWHELLDCIAAAWTRRPGLAEALESILRRPEVEASSLGARLAPLRVGKPAEYSRVFSELGDAARAGASRAGILACLEELGRPRAPASGGPPDDTGFWIALARSALEGILRPGLDRPGGQGGSPKTEAPGATDVLLWPPVIPATPGYSPTGAASPGSTREAGGGPVATLIPASMDPSAGGARPDRPVLQRGVRGEWEAYDRATGRTRWTLATLASSARTFVPVVDGSIILLADGQVLRVDAQTGHVLWRTSVDGSPMVAWPDPGDRTRLVVALMQQEPQAILQALHPTLYAGSRLVRFTAEGKADTLMSDQNDLYVALQPYRAARDFIERCVKSHERDGPSTTSPSIGESTPTTLPAQVMAALDLDTTSPDLAVHALARAGRGAWPAWRQEMARRAAGATDLFPIHAVAIGSMLDQCGFPAGADRLYRQAGDRFLDLGGNADLSAMLAGSPVILLRRAGGILFAQGQVERSLALVEVGRTFSTYVEGDHAFYRRYLAWLDAQGRREDAARIAPRIAQSAQAGGARLLSASSYLLTDVSLMMFPLTCMLLFLTVVRLWERCGRTQAADLYARGMRTNLQIAFGLFTQPIDWLSHSILSYSDRGARLLVALLGLLALEWASVFVSNQTTAAQLAGTAAMVGTGLPSRDDFVRFLEQQLAAGGVRDSTLTLLAEARHARGEVPAARDALARLLAHTPSDAEGLNNRGVLEEAAGDMSAARADYSAASVAHGEATAAARWNLARLAGDAVALEKAAHTLAHRDALPALHHGRTRPLWAHASYGDLMDTVLDAHGLLRHMGRAFLEIASGHIQDATAQMVGSDDDATPLLFMAVVYLAIVLTLLALAWLPFQVRRLHSERIASDGSLRGRALAALDLVFPGSLDVFAGPIGRGVMKMLLLGIGWSIALATLLGGVASAQTLEALPKIAGHEYFAGIPLMRGYAQATGAIETAIVLLLVLYVHAIYEAFTRARKAG